MRRLCLELKLLFFLLICLVSFQKNLLEYSYSVLVVSGIQLSEWVINIHYIYYSFFKIFFPI